MAAIVIGVAGCGSAARQSVADGWFFRYFQKKAGGIVPSANRISLLRDVDGDGVAEVRSALLEDLLSPFGMALVDDQLYIANSDALVRFPYADGDTTITAPPTRVTDLPAGPTVTSARMWTRGSSPSDPTSLPPP